MKNTAFTLWLLLCILGTTALAAEPSPALDLPATRIFSKGSNGYAGEVLEITKGRGAIIGWYVQAKQSEEVRVSIEYACAKPLNQAYQLSFDGHDKFWEVSRPPKVTGARRNWAPFKYALGCRCSCCWCRLRARNTITQSVSEADREGRDAGQSFARGNAGGTRRAGCHARFWPEAGRTAPGARHARSG